MVREAIPELDLFSDEPDAQLDFDVQPIVDQLAATVTTCRTPFHIGVFAPWGAGKSTALDALERRVAGQVRVVRLNAWKYRNDSLQRKFLLTVAQELSPGSKEALKRRMYSIITGLNDKNSWSATGGTDRKWWQRFWRQIRTPFFLTIGVLLLVLLTAFVQALIVTRGLIWNMDGLWLWLEKVEGYLGAPLLTFLITTGLGALGKVYIDDSNLQLTNQEQFEEQFQESLKQLKADERVLILVDELDRCSPAQVLEALETVKTFMNLPKCVFVLACDRGVVEDAVARSAELAGWRASKYLEKIFQLAIHLPPVHSGGMMRYAEGLLRHSIDSRDELLGRAIRENRVLEILIRPGVSTPRRAKRLLNDFLARYSLARRREQDWQEAKLTDDLPFLAKMSVIMSEFAYFLEPLSVNADLMRWLNQIRRGRAAELEPYQLKACSAFFATTADGAPDWENPLPEHTDLIQFLGQTWQFDADGEKVRRHLYLGRDPEGASVGDGFLREVLTMAEAGQMQSLKARVAESKNPDAVLGFLARQVQFAGGNLQQNLLLSLLELSEYALPGADGARQAALMLESYGELLSAAQMASDVPPTAVMPYVEMMQRSARRQWLGTISQWIQGDPSVRGEALIDIRTLPHLTVLAENSELDVSTFLSEWLNTPAGQEAYRSRIHDLDEGAKANLQAVLLPLLSRFAAWLRDRRSGKPETTAFSGGEEVRVWLEVFGVDALLEREGPMFWDLMLNLLHPYPAVGRDWVVPLLCEHYEQIPESLAEPLLTSAIFAQDKTSAEGEWQSVLLLTDAMLAKHGRHAVDAGATLAMAALLDNGVPTVGLRPIADLVSRHWAVWAPNSQSKFHARLIRTISPWAPAESILDAVSYLRMTGEAVQETNLMAYVESVDHLVRQRWTDGERVELFGLLIGEKCPFELPAAVRTELAVDAFDMLTANLAYEEHEAAAHSGLHRLLRVIPLRWLVDRTPRIERFLVDESDLQETLETLSEMATRSDELDYAAVAVGWAEALAGHTQGLLALARWVQANAAVCPLAAVQKAAGNRPDTVPWLSVLAGLMTPAEGGDGHAGA